jgi:steroid delta-isomerase-like uncharacterized protein
MQHFSRPFVAALVVLLFAFALLSSLVAQEETTLSVPAVQFVVDVFNTGELDAAADYIAPDFVFHELNNPDIELEGIDGFAQWTMGVRHLFSDFHVAIDDEVADGDRVAISWTLTGTQTGEFQGFPASGNEVTLEGMSMIRLEDDKIVDWWHSVDGLALLTQIGAFPLSEAEE